MYARFHKAYYRYDYYETLLTVSSFLSNSHWLLTIRQVHQERHCKCTNKIWLQKECTHKYYCLLSHFTRSRNWILSVDQHSAQNHVNCECFGKDKNGDALRLGQFRKTVCHDRTVCGRIYCKDLLLRGSCREKNGAKKEKRSLPLHFCMLSAMQST